MRFYSLSNTFGIVRIIDYRIPIYVPYAGNANDTTTGTRCYA